MIKRVHDYFYYIPEDATRREKVEVYSWTCGTAVFMILLVSKIIIPFY